MGRLHGMVQTLKQENYCVIICTIRIQCNEQKWLAHNSLLVKSYMLSTMKFVVRRQRVPFSSSFASTIGTLVPTPTLSSLPNSGDVRPFKFVLSSSKRIAAWFGIRCEDCPTNTIWGCYVTKSCWKVVIVALGVVFLFIAFLMSLFFLGQIDDLLKYQRQLAEWEKSYPTLAKLMISPLKLIYNGVTKTCNNMMKSLTKKFGSKPWFKFVILWPCTCLKGTWTVFQKILQPTCLFCYTVTSKVKKCIEDSGLPDFIMKKIGIRADPIGDAKRKKKLEKKAIEEKKQAKIDARKVKKQAKIDAREAKKKSREDAKQAMIDAKREKIEEKQEELKAEKEAKLEVLEVERETKQEVLEDKREAKQEAKKEAFKAEKGIKQKAREVAQLETKEVVKETKKVDPEEIANGLNVLESPSPPQSPPPPPPSPIPLVAKFSVEMPSTMSTIPPTMSLAPPNNTMAPLIAPVAPLEVFMTPPTIINQQPILGDSSQQFFASAYGDPTQQTTTDVYGTMAQQYPLDPYGVSTSQYATNSYVGYGVPTEQIQGHVYGAYDNPIYTTEQYGIYGNGPLYGQQGGFGQTQQGNFGQFQEQGSLRQALQQGGLAQVQYGATTSYGHDPNTTDVQQYYGGRYYNQ